ncbi:hypothetical protein [Sutcliffiella horikoshii]|uniref:hypothetical protein n=1 Tax=Sutcliffiella horikoshii TaxID=79883 RepID=UPI003CF48FDB
MKEKALLLTNSEKERLISLLQYASEAIDYWFDGCEVSEQTTIENEMKKQDCDYFLQKLKEE